MKLFALLLFATAALFAQANAPSVVGQVGSVLDFSAAAASGTTKPFAVISGLMAGTSCSNSGAWATDGLTPPSVFNCYSGTWHLFSSGATGVTTFNTRNGAVTLTSADVTTALTFTPENIAHKDAASGYAGLTSGSLLKAAEMPLPSASTLGGIQSITSVAHDWVAYIDTSGVPHQSQPAVGDISGFGTGVATALAAAVSGTGSICLSSGSTCTASGGYPAVTSPNGSINISGSGTSAVTVDSSTTYLNGLYGQLAAANTYTPGSVQSFSPSSTAPGLVIVPGSVPSAMGSYAGGLFVTATGIFGTGDGTNISYLARFIGSGTTAPVAPTNGHLAGLTSVYGVTDLGPFSDVKDYPSANCVSSTGGSAWDTALTAACVGESNNVGGWLPFADASTGQFKAHLPGDWDGSEPYINLVFDSATNTTGTMIFEVQTGCIENNGSTTDNPTFSTAQVFSTATAAAANRIWSETLRFNAVTSGNSCVANGTVIVKITRNTDTASAVVGVTEAIITTGRLIVLQAN